MSLGKVAGRHGSPDVRVRPACRVRHAPLDERIAGGKPYHARVVLHVSERLASLGLLAGSIIGIVAAGDERRPERTPAFVDSAGASDVDQHEGLSDEHPAPTDKLGHLRVADQTFHRGPASVDKISA